MRFLLFSLITHNSAADRPACHQTSYTKVVRIQPLCNMENPKSSPQSIKKRSPRVMSIQLYTTNSLKYITLFVYTSRNQITRLLQHVRKRNIQLSVVFLNRTPTLVFISITENQIKCI